MSDSNQIEPNNSPGDRKRRELSGLGVVFALVGVALLLTMDSPAIGLPFIVLGLVFFGMGFSKKRDGPKP